MNIKIYYIFLLSVIGIMIACQPGKVVKKDQTALPDSALYYQQADIADPFLDTIFQEPDQAITINQKIYPLYISDPIQKFKEAEGFRVQVFAGSDPLKVESVRHEIATITDDSVHFFDEKGLYKVQVGDYLYRYLADNMKTKMRQNGYPGAWVVQRTILVPIDSIATDSLMVEDSIKVNPGSDTGKYKIQLVVTGSLEKAEDIINSLQPNTESRVFYEQSGNLYKVFVGLFEEEYQAREELEKMRQLGYPDAWLVY
jgi:hypothetical protein